MLRVSEEATVKKDHYGNPPLHYVGWTANPTPFQTLVAEEAVAALDEREARAAGIGPLGRFVDDALALKLLLNVQKYSLWFHDFSHADMRKLQHGNDEGEHRLLVTRFEKGDYIMRKGEAATFLAILLQVQRTATASARTTRALHTATRACTAQPPPAASVEHAVAASSTPAASAWLTHSS
jgi:hypothetical protein